MPRISVLLSSLNHGRFIAESIQSVLDQTFSDFELIIIDDCSEDDSWSIIQSFRDPRIRAFRNPERRRGATGFNDAIRNLARGEYIAIHHSDDVWRADKLQKQLSFLDAHADVAAAFSHAALIDDEGLPFTDAGHHYHGVFDQANRSRFQWLNRFFYHGNCLCHPSALIRKRCFDEVGLYDRRLGQITDLDLWVRICLRFEIHVVQQPLTQFRVHANEANQSGRRLETLIRGQFEHQQILRHYLSLTSSEDFAQIFPSAGLLRAGENNLPFLVAMAGVHSDLVSNRAFGVAVLYDLMKDQATAANLEQLYGFRYPDLIRLTGSRDAFRSDLAQELERIMVSRSWRLTKPLRLINKLRSTR